MIKLERIIIHAREQKTPPDPGKPTELRVKPKRMCDDSEDEDESGAPPPVSAARGRVSIPPRVHQIRFIIKLFFFNPAAHLKYARVRGGFTQRGGLYFEETLLARDVRGRVTAAS